VVLAITYSHRPHLGPNWVPQIDVRLSNAAKHPLPRPSRSPAAPPGSEPVLIDAAAQAEGLNADADE